jgi:multisubunit Na+/H+ antiporter MnhB subunit
VRAALGLLFDLALVLVTAALAAVILAPGWMREGPVAAVADAMAHSGVAHPVTAVLLNFRGYDTLLEMLVLLLALLGVRSLGALPPPPDAEPASPVLLELLRFLAPLLVLVAAYLLWRGSTGPGGAFQAGAVLGAAGVLWLLTERPRGDEGSTRLLRPVLALGVAAFSLAGLAFTFAEGAFLAYPPARAGGYIFAIEALATLSIAATLVVLFIGARSGED